MKIQEHVSLSSLSTFRSGGKARYFAHVTNSEELKDVVLFARDKNLSFFVLGGGSNLLFSDKGFEGVIVKVDIRGISFGREGGSVSVKAGSGEGWDTLVETTVKKNLHGLENLSLIPGTVGAAPVQNVGAYGTEVKDVLIRVHVFDTESFTFKVLSRDECGFGYRDSVFKKTDGKKFIVTEIELILEENGRVNISYKDLKEYFDQRKIESPTIHEVRDAVCVIRKNKLPDWKVLGTAGSFFKNPIITKEQFEVLQSMFPLIPSFHLGNDLVKIPAAWVLDKVLNLKGYREGSVGLYEKQPLAVVNYGGATSEEIKNFSDLIILKFFNATGITLEREVELVGDFDFSS